MTSPRATCCVAQRAMALGAVAGLALASLGCHVYDASLLDEGLDASRDAGPAEAAIDMDAGGGEDAQQPIDADMDAGTDAPAPPPTDSGCALRHPPERPVAADPTPQPVHWFAIHQLDIGVGVRWQNNAYDLDGRCTDPFATMPEVECAPPPGFSPPADGPGGVDNSFGQAFIPVLTLVEPDYQDIVNASIERGDYGILFRVAQWNGTPTDPVVDFALVDSPAGFATGGSRDAGPPPSWDGSDEWIASTRSFVSGDLDRPLARDSAAYVVDDVLVAHPRDGTEVSITGTRTVTLRLTRMIVTARIADGGHRLEDVIIAGRWAVDDIFDTLPRGGICPGTDNYTATQESLRRSADITTDGVATPFLLCNALSAGLGGQGVLVTVSQFGEALPIVDFCVDGGAPP